jgi:PAS domain S-box-containing protein
VLARMVLVLAAGVFFAWWLAARVRHDLRAQILQQGIRAAQALDARKMAALPFENFDRSREDFQSLVQQMRVLSHDLQVWWAPASKYVGLYSMKKRADQIVFGPENIPVDDPRSSLPGTVYQAPPEALIKVFATGQPAVTGPFTDEYGTFVSAFVPLLDPATRQLVAVIGLDIMADDLQQILLAKMAIPLGLALVLVIGMASSLAASQRVEASPQPVLRRLFPIMVVLAACLVAGAAALFLRQNQLMHAMETATRVVEVRRDLRTATEQQSLALAATAQWIASEARVQAAVRAGDITTLSNMWQFPHATWRRELKFTHFYFLDTNRVCLLRLHQPARRGDRIDRFTALQAERTGRAAAGLELGPLGTLTLRVVQPILAGGALVGYVELGKEMDEVLADLPTDPEESIAVAIHKEFLDRQTWLASRRELGREAEWDRFARNVVTYSSPGRLPEAFAPWVDPVADAVGRLETSPEILFDGKWWRLSAVPLRDVAGKDVGALLITRNISSQKAAMARLLVTGGSAAAVLLTLLLGFIYAMLRRTDASLRAQQEQLQRSEEQYRLLSESSSDVIWLFDLAADRFSYVSPAVEKLLGYTPAEASQMGMAAVLTPESFQLLQDVLPARLASFAAGDGAARSQIHEVAQRRRDGSSVPTEVVTTLIAGPDGLATHVQGVTRDISERKQAEAELRRLNRAIHARSECYRVLIGAREEEAFLEQVCRILVVHGGYRLAWIGFPMPDAAKTVRPMAQVGLEPGYLDGLQITWADTERGRGPTGTCLRTRQPAVSRDVAHDPAMAPWRQLAILHGFNATAAFPLLHDGHLLGALAVYGNQPDAFNGGEMELLTELAANLAFGIATLRTRAARAQAELEVLALNRELEQRVRERTAEALDLYHNAPCGYHSLGPEGRVLQMNDTELRWLGYQRAEVEGCLDFAALVAPASRPAFTRQFADLQAAGGKYSISLEMRRQDGSTYTALVNATVVRDAGGRLVKTHANSIDITGLRKANEKLRKLSQAVEYSPSMIQITDRQGNLEYVNPAWEQTTGYGLEETLGQKPSIVKSGTHSREFYTRMWREISLGRIWRGEICNRKKHGELYWEAAAIAPVQDEAGNITHFVAIKEDITERRQSAAELRLAKEAAESANRAKSAFLASMSHEIRTPMNAILGFSQLLLADPQLSSGQREQVATITRSGKHLLGLINNILEMARIESGRAALNPATFDLHQLLADLELMFRLRAQGGKLGFKVVRLGDLPRWIRADETRLRQVLINLLGNAVKFTPAGGSITLRVGCTGERDQQLRLHAEVEDTGQGIAPEDVPNLFQAFFQTRTGRETVGGTGLGLAISREFVRLMGGDLSVTSQLGTGSTFRFDIRVAPGNATEARAVMAGAPRVLHLRPDLPACRVLAVDDLPENCDLLERLLGQAGFEIRTAGSGAEALPLVAQWRPHLVVLDLRMPGMDGWEVARRLRAEQGQGLKILALSASAFQEDQQRALDAGADAFLAKPFQPAGLLECIKDLAGVEYVYENPGLPEPAAPVETGPELPSAAEVARLPAELVAELADATTRAAYDKILELVGQVSARDESLGLRLLRLVERFDYSALQKLLSMRKLDS